MRFTGLLIVFLFIIISADAQEFKKFSIQLGSGQGYNWPTYQTSSSSPALLFFAEPSYRIKNNLSVGFKWEGGRGGGVTNGSYGPNVQYYFSDNSFRPFAGFGVGFYHPGYYSDAQHGTSSTHEETSFGFYPRIGFEFHHLVFTVDYNVVGSSNLVILDGTPTGTTAVLENGYLAMKLGVRIGGGVKK